MTLRVIVVDDEPLGRRGIVARLTGREGIEIVAECANGAETVTAVRRYEPDLLFLDVQMPGLDGFEVLRRLKPEERPQVIFVTAWERHAIRAFAVHALDYLLKPIDDERFEEALHRATDASRRERESALGRRMAALLEEMAPAAAASSPPRSQPAPGGDRFVIQQKDRVVLIRHAEIDWIEAEGDYVRLHAGSRNWLIRGTMLSMADALAGRRFVRIHRSTIVNIDRVHELRSFDGGDCAVVLRDGTELRLGRSYRHAVRRLMP